MSGAFGGIINSLGSLGSTETVTGLVGLLGSALGIGGMPTTSQLEGLLDPAPDWMWTADIVNVSGLSELSNVFIKDISFSYTGIMQDQRYRNGIYQYFPKSASVTPCNIVFYEPYNYSISYYLEQWRQLIRNPSDGSWGVPANYMGTIIIRLYDYTGLQQMSVQLDGAWPTHQMPLNYQYAQSQPVQTSAEFSINTATITYIGTGFSTLLGTGSVTTDLLSVGSSLVNALTSGNGTPVNGLVQLI